MRRVQAIKPEQPFGKVDAQKAEDPKRRAVVWTRRFP